jgi:hypothetical protein
MDRTLTYATCGLLIIAYAWARFNTPPSNRSSTDRPFTGRALLVTC